MIDAKHMQLQSDALTFFEMSHSIEAGRTLSGSAAGDLDGKTGSHPHRAPRLTPRRQDIGLHSLEGAAGRQCASGARGFTVW